MTRAKSRTIESVIEEYASWYEGRHGNNSIYLAEALKEIETLIKETKPKKRSYVYESKESNKEIMKSAIAFKMGYNSGTDDYEANLLKILGGESEHI